VWELVSGLLTDLDQLREDLERMIEVEREGMRADPGREVKAWLDKLSEVDRQRSRAQAMAIEGLLDYEELKTKLAALEETRETARRELARLEEQQEKVARLERDKDALLESYANRAPEALYALTSQERRHVYGMLKAKVFLYPDERLEITGAFTEDLTDDLTHDPQVCALSETRR
jgi:DNA repair exonuclease SbcCD ATPase subunit